MSIDRDQHFEDLDALLRVALDGLQAKTWTMLICYVESCDGNTAVLQPAVKGIKVLVDGTSELFDLPQLLDCPVVWPQGGNQVLTFALRAGDEVAALIACRNLDGWWQSGGQGANAPQAQPMPRMHHLADAICVPGLRCKPRALSSVSTTSAQLRSVDGSTYVEVKDDASVNVRAAGKITAVGTGDVEATSTGGKVKLVSATEIDLSAPLINLTGVVKANGVVIDETHTHGGVQTGAGISGPVTP